MKLKYNREFYHQRIQLDTIVLDQWIDDGAEIPFQTRDSSLHLASCASSWAALL